MELAYSQTGPAHSEESASRALYKVGFEQNCLDLRPRDKPTFTVTSQNQLALGRCDIDYGWSLLIPVELTNFVGLANFLNLYRATDMWEQAKGPISGTLQVKFLQDDHGIEPLLLLQTAFEIDKISHQQLIGQEAKILQDLDLFLSWAEFILGCLWEAADEEVMALHQAAGFVIDQFMNWDASYMAKVLFLCKVDGGVRQLVSKFPDAFRYQEQQ
jgi:hypothetical protein